jgi:hypothetical protein
MKENRCRQVPADTKRRKTMSTKSKTQTSKADPLVNSVIIGLGGKEALVTAEHKKGGDEKLILVSVSGGLSTKATIRGLRSIVSHLEMKGLPVKPTTEEWVPMDLVSKGGSGHSQRNL